MFEQLGQFDRGRVRVTLGSPTLIQHFPCLGPAPATSKEPGQSQADGTSVCAGHADLPQVTVLIDRFVLETACLEEAGPPEAIERIERSAVIEDTVEAINQALH